MRAWLGKSLIITFVKDAQDVYFVYLGVADEEHPKHRASGISSVWTWLNLYAHQTKSSNRQNFFYPDNSAAETVKTAHPVPGWRSAVPSVQRPQPTLNNSHSTLLRFKMIRVLAGSFKITKVARVKFTAIQAILMIPTRLRSGKNHDSRPGAAQVAAASGGFDSRFRCRYQQFAQ